MIHGSNGTGPDLTSQEMSGLGPEADTRYGWIGRPVCASGKSVSHIPHRSLANACAAQFQSPAAANEAVRGIIRRLPSASS